MADNYPYVSEPKLEIGKKYFFDSANEGGFYSHSIKRLGKDMVHIFLDGGTDNGRKFVDLTQFNGEIEVEKSRVFGQRVISTGWEGLDGIGGDRDYKCYKKHLDKLTGSVIIN